MGKLIKYIRGPFILCFLAVVVALGASAAQASSQTSTCKLATEPSQPIAGQDTNFKLTILDMNNKPITSARPSLTAEKIQRSNNIGGMMGGSQMGGMSMSGNFMSDNSSNQMIPITVQATPGKNPGEYSAMLKLDTEGDWNITVANGPDRQDFTITVLPSTSQTMAPGTPGGMTNQGGTNNQGDMPNQSGMSNQDGMSGQSGMTTSGNSATMNDKNTVDLGDYLLTFKSADQTSVNTNFRLEVAVSDAKTGLPKSGLNIELIPVPLPQQTSGEAMAMDSSSSDMQDMKDMNGVLSELPARENTSEPGTYGIQQKFHMSGQYAVVVQIDGSKRYLADFPFEVTTEDNSASMGSNQPNYWFLGSIGAVLGITMLTVGMQKRKMQLPGRTVAS